MVELKKVDGLYRAYNYLSVGQLYLKSNPLLKEEIKLSDVKEKVIGHWGTVPGQNMIYAHLNRVIKKYDLNMFYISGPGHGGNAPISGAYIDGSISEYYKNITLDELGMEKLFKRFSFPGGVSSHASPELPGSIHEGGELGYSLSHAYGAVLDNPKLIAACVVGDGEAETGSLATSWHLNKFLNINTDGVVLPILHLNGFKINNPTIFSRMTKEELFDYFIALGYYPYYVSGKNEKKLHQELSKAMDKAIEKILLYKSNKKEFKKISYPMIIFRSPKGMSGPKDLVGTSDAHQVPFQVKTLEDAQRLSRWLKSYKPEKLFDENGKLLEKFNDIVPIKKNTMSMNAHANGGRLLKEIELPEMKDLEFKFVNKGAVLNSDMMHLGLYLKEVFKLNKLARNFRIFGPDEAMSNRLNHVFEFENKRWNMDKLDSEVLLTDNGRVLDGILSEHFCEGALEGYLLSGRHGLMHSYEAFIRVVDSMTSQHAKWLKMCSEIPWRKDISSLNYILTSHAWQQDHNGYTHQEPGFISHLMNKKQDFINVYLPIDANSLMVCTNEMLKTKNKINAVVASKHQKVQWLTLKESKDHLKKGISEFTWASNEGTKPDIILACAGDTPTGEMLIAAKILEKEMPNLKFKFINVLDLTRLGGNSKKTLSDAEFDALFTKNKPVIFSFHGYPNLIKSLVYNRNNKNFIVHGYEEEGTITTPFDMRVLNKIDRFNIILEVLRNVKKENKKLEEYALSMLKKHSEYIKKYGKDLEEIENFVYNDIENKEN